MSVEKKRESDNEVYNALVQDIEEVDGEETAYIDFYREVEFPSSPISTPLDVKVRMAKGIMAQIEKDLTSRLGHKEFIWIDFYKRIPHDVVEAIQMIYEDQDWFVSPRQYNRPKRDSRTNKKVFGNIVFCTYPIPSSGKMPWSRNEDEDDVDGSLDIGGADLTL